MTTLIEWLNTPVGMVVSKGEIVILVTAWLVLVAALAHNHK